MGTKHKTDIAIIDSGSSTAESRQLLNIHILSVTMGAKKRTGPVAATAMPNSKTGISKQADTREIRQESELAVPSTTTQSWPAPQMFRPGLTAVTTHNKRVTPVGYEQSQHGNGADILPKKTSLGEAFTMVT
ncbi:hypothetical protein TURU_102689 [Turdus rufiventris]|nr:hypothetical protein TURU_102689 [Turdus rufiventris]